MPSFSEMVELFGVRSKSVVNFWIDKLIEAQILEKDDKGHLKFKKSSFAIPMVGSIQAGFPSPEEEALCDILSMDEYLVTKPESSFLLQVSGDSMIGEGIMEGGLVIVEKGRQRKILSERTLISRFQHFIETTDWEERHLCNRWIDKTCLGGIVFSALYFTTILVSSLMK